MNLLDLYETREPYQQAIDRLEARRIEDLNTKMDDLITRAREAKTPEHKAGLAREFQKCKNERDGYYKIKEQQAPSNTPPAHKGIGDLQDPKQKMAQLQQKAKKGPLANVGAGLKAFLKGEPEPMDEQVDQSGSSPRAYGVANFQRLVKANMGNIPTVTLEFANPADNIKLDKRGIDLISDYYDSLDSDSTKNHFIYRVLPSADETNNILQKLGYTIQTQQNLPGISAQGELPLSEKKKFDKDEPVKSADVKVDRELQKLRAQYPAAGSDLETVARAEIDSTERSQRQLATIRGANEKQDVLLKQLVQLDQDQGREIDGLDQENDTLEQRLAQVQATNDRLQQAIGQMSGNKKSTTKTDNPKADVAKGGIIDVTPQVVTLAPAAKSAAQTVNQQPTKSPAIDAMTRQIQGFSQPAPNIRGAEANDPQQKVAAESADDDRYNEPVKKKGVAEGAMDSLHADLADVYNRLAPKIEHHKDSFLAGQLYDALEAVAEKNGAESEFKRMMNSARNRAHMEYDTNPGGFHNWFWFLPFADDQNEGVAEEQKPGFGEFPPKQEITIVPPKKLKSGETYQDRNKYWQSQGQAPIYKTNEEKEPNTRQELLNRLDKIQRMMTQDRNPANLQILRKELEMLKQRYQHLREDNDSEAIERAIINRIMVSHTDLLMKYGPGKVMQAAEEVSYNVGDVDEIGTSDVSAYVVQVQQILGATP